MSLISRKQNIFRTPSAASRWSALARRNCIGKRLQKHRHLWPGGKAKCNSQHFHLSSFRAKSVNERKTLCHSRKRHKCVGSTSSVVDSFMNEFFALARSKATRFSGWWNVCHMCLPPVFNRRVCFMKSKTNIWYCPLTWLPCASLLSIIEVFYCTHCAWSSMKSDENSNHDENEVKQSTGWRSMCFR